MSPRRRWHGWLVAAVILVALALPAYAQADFGLRSFSAVAEEADGSLDLQAGSHPFAFTVRFETNRDTENRPEGRIKDLFVDLPAGLIGNPQAVPPCEVIAFDGTKSICPSTSQVGIVEFTYENGNHAEAGLYNLVPPAGVAARLGFSAVGLNSFQDGSLRDSDYGLSVADLTFPNLGIEKVEERVWGVPASKSHDAERFCAGEESGGCPIELSTAPFLTLPTSCSAPLRTTIRVDSVDSPGVFDTQTSTSLDENGLPAELENCEAPSFEPAVTIEPEASTADSPTGLGVNIEVPQIENPNALGLAGAFIKELHNGVSSSHLKDAVVTLPAGIAVNPSAAGGLAACPLTGDEGINLPRSTDAAVPEPAAVGEAAKCPPASKIGSVELRTPLLDHAVKGSVFLARQNENPFGSLLALYVALQDPVSGVVVKLAGKVEPDPITGQLTATFLNNPQLPFENLNLSFFGGPRATLTTPSTCGSYTSTGALTPWTAPEGGTVTRASSFQIISAADGSGCPATEAQLPNASAFEAGTTVPLAGSYSPFVLKVSRENGSQRISALDATLPEGLVGKLAGVPYCSNAAIAAAASKSGASEQASPSCPSASDVGTVNVGAGSGTPFYVGGHAYLAGPYKGAPLSLEIITPAVAGPFDLGTVAVRTALFVDPLTAQIHAVSDPIPSILAGIPLDIRSIALNLSRPKFTLNPTSCDPMAVLGATTSTLGQVAPLQSRFQVGGCNGLAFAPKLALRLSGSTQRGKDPALRAVLTQASGQANINKVAVVLPKSEFIDNRHINNPCTRIQFNAGPGNGAQCPRESILGYAAAYTPLLDKPLKGRVYFRSNGGERELPDLVASLGGQVHLNLVGYIDSVQKKGSEVSRTRNTFAMVPDAPVSKFILSLKGGKHGLLQNSANLCKVENRATVKATGQNGKLHDFSKVVANSCGGNGRKRHGNGH